MKRISNILLNLLITLSLLITACMSIQRLNGSKFPTVFGYGFAVVLTGSMEPTIPTGSVILVHEENEYKEGDIITFESKLFPSVTHRYYANLDGEILTKGDANNAVDNERITEDQILGKVICIIPFGKEIWLTVKEPWFLPVVLSILLGAYIVADISQRRKQKENAA